MLNFAVFDLVKWCLNLLKLYTISIKVVLETRMVGLIAHLDYCTLAHLDHISFAGNRVRILPANSKQTHNSNQRNSDPVSPGQFTIFIWIKTKLVYPPKFSIAVVSNFSRTKYYSSLKRNTRQNICKILGGKQGALWSMWKLWMLQWICVLRRPRRVFRLLTSDLRLKTSYFKLQTSDLTKFELRISNFW